MLDRAVSLFAPVTLHGYGLPYTILENEIHIGVTSWRDSSVSLPADEFAAAIESALLDICSLLRESSPKL